MDYDSWLERPYVEAAEAEDEHEAFVEYLEGTYEDVGNWCSHHLYSDGEDIFYVDDVDFSHQKHEGWEYKKTILEYDELVAILTEKGI